MSVSGEIKTTATADVTVSKSNVLESARREIAYLAAKGSTDADWDKVVMTTDDEKFASTTLADGINTIKAGIGNLLVSSNETESGWTLNIRKPNNSLMDTTATAKMIELLLENILLAKWLKMTMPEAAAAYEAEITGAMQLLLKEIAKRGRIKI